MAKRAELHLFASHDGQQIAFYSLGEPTAPAVLLAHGYGASSVSNWLAPKIAQRLASAGFRVVAIDLRGHGESAKPTDPALYTSEQEVRDIVALADHLGLESYAAVGYSHGSIEVAKLLTIDPHRIVCGVLGGIGDLLSDPKWKQENGIDTIAVGLEREVGLERPEPGGGQGSGMAAMMAEAGMSNDDMLALACVQRGQSVTSAEELGMVSCPVLCLNGRDDDANGDKLALAGMIPNSELVWVPP